MKENFTKSLSSILIVSVLFLLAACRGDRSDDAILKDINDSLQTRAFGVTAKVHDGTVQLSGECEGENCADSLAAMVREINGVEEVQNEVKGIEAKTDLTLRTSVQTIISKYQGVQADVVAGVVILRGTIQRDQLQPLMNELSSLGAKKIDNQLAVQ
jgi:osmotically-inducible protein OsmY